MPLITKETAAAMAAKAVATRKANKAIVEAKLAQLAALTEFQPDEFVSILTSACSETLAKLRQVDDPQGRAQLAKALRDLRETYHLATGKPRPGIIREERSRFSRREVPRIVDLPSQPTISSPVRLDTEPPNTNDLPKQP